MSNLYSDGISTSTASSITDVSGVNPGIGSISLTIALDLTYVSPNLEARLEYIIGIDIRSECRTTLPSALSPVQK